MSLSLGEGGENAYPIKKSLGFAEDGKSNTFQIDDKPNQCNNFIITGRGFRPVDDYPESFNTK